MWGVGKNCVNRLRIIRGKDIENMHHIPTWTNWQSWGTSLCFISKGGHVSPQAKRSHSSSTRVQACTLPIRFNLLHATISCLNSCQTKNKAVIGRSLLNNEQIQTAVRTHLLTLVMGEVTPRWFHHTLNVWILLALRYMLMRWLSECTARWWLIKLEWQCTMLKKGVYIDGHKRPDMVEY